MADELIIKPKIKIKVFGVGGGGNNAIARMGQHKTLDIELTAINSDKKQLEYIAASGVNLLAIGENLTAGRGTGGNVELGEQAAQEAKADLKNAINGADMIFIAATLGGGFGTGAAPVIAKIAKEMGVLSVGVVTMPFMFEGGRKKKTALDGIVKLQSQMDALIVVENDNLMKLPENRKMSFKQAFVAADNILKQAISCIAELILTTGVINVDFADVTTILRQSDSSDALLAIGNSNKSAVEAVKAAVSSPLNNRGLMGARGVIINITGSDKLSLFDVEKATDYINEETKTDVNVILGTVIDNELADNIRITLIATDFVDSIVKKTAPIEVPKSTVRQEVITQKVQTANQQLAFPNFIGGQMGNGTENAVKQPFVLPAFSIVGNNSKNK